MIGKVTAIFMWAAGETQQKDRWMGRQTDGETKTDRVTGRQTDRLSFSMTDI